MTSAFERDYATPNLENLFGDQFKKHKKSVRYLVMFDILLEEVQLELMELDILDRVLNLQQQKFWALCRAADLNPLGDTGLTYSNAIENNELPIIEKSDIFEAPAMANQSCSADQVSPPGYNSQNNLQSLCTDLKLPLRDCAEDIYLRCFAYYNDHWSTRFRSNDKLNDLYNIQVTTTISVTRIAPQSHQNEPHYIHLVCSYFLNDYTDLTLGNLLIDTSWLFHRNFVLLVCL